MGVLVFLSILAATFCGVVAWMVARRGLATRASREFFLPLVLLVAFNLSQAALFRAPNAESAWYWHAIGLTCWALVLSLQFWLVLGLTRPRRVPGVWLPLVMLPAIVIAARLVMFPIGDGVIMTQTELGWARDFSRVPRWGATTMLVVAAYAVASLVLLARWWSKATSRRERLQAGWILYSGIVAVALNVVFVIANPFVVAPRMPWLPHMFAAVWVAGYAVAIRRYRLIPVSSAQAIGTILAGIQDLVLLLDEQGRILEANPRSLGLLGFEANALVGRAVESLFRESGEMREAIAVFHARNEPARSFESTMITREGTDVPVLVNGSAVLDREGDRVGIVVVIQDLRPMREYLKAERIESIGTLAGGIAHDFNNLLTAVSGFVSLALMDAGDAQKVSARLTEASRACERAQDLTRQLLTFSRGGVPIRRATSIAEIARESATFVGVGSNVRIEIEAAPGLWLADADGGQFGQVVHNLVLNAVQAMPDGGTVRLMASNVPSGGLGVDGFPVEDDRVRLTVADEGLGIDPDCLSRVFDPFFTTKKAGTGLGLAIVFSIVRRHGGKVALDSQVNRGTTVSIDLPRSRRSTGEQPRHVDETWAASGRVLLMDDQVGVRRVGEEMLRRLGYDVVTCADGESALLEHQKALTEGCPFDVAILDLTVPGGLGGAEVVGELRARQPGLKTIVSSGYAPDAEMADFRRRGFDGLLPKPYSMERLQGAMSRVLHPGQRGEATTGGHRERIPEVP